MVTIKHVTPFSNDKFQLRVKHPFYSIDDKFQIRGRGCVVLGFVMAEIYITEKTNGKSIK